MCGRYAASATATELVETFRVDETTEEGVAACQPRFNIAPTDPVPAIVERSGEAEPVRKLVELAWGLVPSWSKDARGAARLINARSETVATKPSFRKAFAARRCLLPAIGYYEWRGETDASGKPIKQPWFLRPADGGLMVMAGIYEFWKSPAREWLATCSIITTQAADGIGWVHDRMPMQVAAGDWDAWLSPEVSDPREAQSLLLTPVADSLQVYPVSREVNRNTTDGPHLIESVSTA